MQTDTLEMQTEISYPELSLSDRCQSASCSAQAFMLVEVPIKLSSSPLDIKYCAHHYNKHSPGLAAVGARVVHDFRYRINEKPTSPEDYQN